MKSFLFYITKEKNTKAHSIRKIIKEEYNLNLSIKAIESQLVLMPNEENLNVLAKQVYENIRNLP